MKIPAASTRRRARIEIIPLIDIIFFLLATFVMTSLSMVKNQGIPLQLPPARTAETRDSAQDWTTISVDASNEYFWNKEPIAPKQLPARLQKLRTENPDPKILIQGDERAFFGGAIRALDEVRAAGISKISVQTRAMEPKEAAGSGG